jgi:hypothetical protein
MKVVAQIHSPDPLNQSPIPELTKPELKSRGEFTAFLCKSVLFANHGILSEPTRFNIECTLILESALLSKSFPRPNWHGRTWALNQKPSTLARHFHSIIVKKSVKNDSQ